MSEEVPNLQPNPFVVRDQRGEERTYVLSKFDCWTGREIISKATASSIPDLEKYHISEEMTQKMMCFVSVVPKSGNPIFLTTKELVKNHVPDWETLDRIEKAMMQYNCSFFLGGKPLTFFDLCLKLVEQKAIEISTTLLQPLSQMVKQPSTN